MCPSQSQRADAKHVTKYWCSTKLAFELFKSLLLCRCPLEENFPISFCQVIQRPFNVAKSKYELSIEIHQTKKTSYFMNVLRNGPAFEDLYFL